jgi:hypothetical protein
MLDNRAGQCFQRSLSIERGEEAMDTPGRATASPRDFLHVLFKRKIQILLFFGATVCAVAIGTAITKPTCETISQILKTLWKGPFWAECDLST